MKKLMVPVFDHCKVIRLTILLTISAIFITNGSHAEDINTNQSEEQIYPYYNNSEINLDTQVNKSSKPKMQDLLLSSPLSNWLPSPNRLTGRTFGAVKRLQQAFIPLFFKLGVIITLLIILTIMVSKTMFIGLSLLAMNFSAFFAKFFLSKEQHSGYQHHSEWHQPTPIIKNIHVHVHKPDASTDHLSSQYYQPQLNYHDRVSDYSGYYVPATSYDQNTGVNQNNLSPEERNYISKIISKLAK